MQPRRKIRVRWFRLAAIVVVGYCCYILVNQQLELSAIRQETDATRVKVDQLRQLNKSFADEKVRLSTPAYLEKLAREELGLAKPGEVPYVPAGKN